MAGVSRQEILDRSLGLMAQRGFVATSMRDLAKACGCNVAILYRHFDSKEAILEAVVAERRQRVFSGDPPVTRRRNESDQSLLTRLFSALLDRDLEYEFIYRIFLGEGMRSNDHVVAMRDDLWRATERAYKQWLVVLFPQLAGRRDLNAFVRTTRTLVQGTYGELVMVSVDRQRALAARSREMAKVLAPALQDE